MPELEVDFTSRSSDWGIWSQDRTARKKPLRKGQSVICRDRIGNTCKGSIDRIDDRTQLVHVALQRDTFRAPARSAYRATEHA